MKLMMIILKQQILAYLWSIIYTQLFITINSFTINTLIVIIYEARCLHLWPQTYYGQIDKRHTSIYTVCQTCKTCPNYSGDSIKRAYCPFPGSCSLGYFSISRLTVSRQNSKTTIQQEWDDIKLCLRETICTGFFA